MRQAGIIKWFGGFNPNTHKLNDYGYIIRENESDLYINRVHLRCKTNLLKKGTPVSFDVGVNYKNNMPQAFKLKLLKNEKEEVLIRECALSNKEEYYAPVMENFVNKIIENDIANLIDEWENLNFRLKLRILFKMCCENIDPSVLEDLREENKFIRAAIIMVWLKDKKGEKSVPYKKASELFANYFQDLKMGNKEIDQLCSIIPKEKNYKVDVNKKWIDWSIFEFLQLCCGGDIAKCIEENDKNIIAIICRVNEIIKYALNTAL